MVNDPIHVAIASYGMSGMVFHGPLLKADPRFQVDAVFERTKTLSEPFFGKEKIVRDYNDIISNDTIDLVIVNTPDYTHNELAKKALQAGKHIVVEKPFVQEPEHGEELIDLANQKGLLLAVFQNRRWDSDFLTIKKVLREGWLGRLVEFESHFDRFRNYIPANTWKEDGEIGAGTTYNLGSHLIDQALCLFGMPQAIYADIRALRSNSKVDDYFDIDLIYPKVKVKLKATYLAKEPGPRFLLHGTEGSFIKPGVDPQEDDLKAGVIPNSKDWGEESPEIAGWLNCLVNGKEKKEHYKSLRGMYPVFYNNLYAALKYNEPLAVQPHEALTVIRLIKLAFESNTKGERIPVNFNSKKEI